MTTSEQEAKTKWCPFSTVAAPFGKFAVNRDNYDGSTSPGTWCIGSRCMAWRWTARVDHGYCGLAGKL